MGHRLQLQGIRAHSVPQQPWCAYGARQEAVEERAAAARVRARVRGPSNHTGVAKGFATGIGARGAGGAATGSGGG